MLSASAIVDLLNDKTYKTPPFIEKWRGIYYGMSLHTTGACPSFKVLNTGQRRDRMQYKGVVYPVNYYGQAYQQIFSTYLLNQHPREPEETYQWRLSQYRPYTRTPFQQVITTIIGAIFQDSNYTITIDNKDDSDYVFGNNFNGKDLVNYVKDNFSWICEDPNGIFITIPREPYYNTTSPKIEPQIYFIPSKDIIVFNSDEVIFNIGDITWAANNRDFFRFKKDDNGKYMHIDGTYGGYYSHMFGRIPAIVAGGIWNTQGFYDSWLNAAKAIADDFVGSKSREQILNKEASLPWIIEASTDCPDCDVSGNILQACQVSQESPNGFRLVRCPTCGGNHSMSHNPGDRLVVKPEQMKDDMIKIVSPDVKVNEYTSKFCADLYDQMMRALHLDYITEAQSAIAKDRDQETRYQFISNISDDDFDRIIRGLITNILSLRNVIATDNGVMPDAGYFEINKPTQFQIKTAAQLLEEYKATTDSQMPDYVKAQHIISYVDKQFGGNEIIKRKAQLINQMDVLSVATEGDKQTRVINGAIDNRTWQFSVYLPSMMDDLIRKHGHEWFCNSSYDVIKAEIDTAFTKIDPVQVVAKESASTASKQ